MIPAANPPLHTGQLLTSRSLPDGAKPNWAIVDFMPSHRGIEWFIEPVNGGERRRLTLSEVYAEFKFEN
jgi:hypothetical protein